MRLLEQVGFVRDLCTSIAQGKGAHRDLQQMEFGNNETATPQSRDASVAFEVKETDSLRANALFVGCAFAHCDNEIMVC